MQPYNFKPSFKTSANGLDPYAYTNLVVSVSDCVVVAGRSNDLKLLNQTVSVLEDFKVVNDQFLVLCLIDVDVHETYVRYIDNGIQIAKAKIRELTRSEMD